MLIKNKNNAKSIFFSKRNLMRTFRRYAPTLYEYLHVIFFVFLVVGLFLREPRVPEQPRGVDVLRAVLLRQGQQGRPRGGGGEEGAVEGPRRRRRQAGRPAQAIPGAERTRRREELVAGRHPAVPAVKKRGEKREQETLRDIYSHQKTV